LTFSTPRVVVLSVIASAITICFVVRVSASPRFCEKPADVAPVPLGDKAFVRGDYKKALIAYNIALEGCSHKPSGFIANLYCKKAICERALGKRHDAFDSAKRCRLGNRIRGDILMNLIRADELYAKGRYYRAGKHYLLAYRKEPTDRNRHLIGIAKCLVKLKRYNGAVDILTRIKSHPKVGALAKRLLGWIEERTAQLSLDIRPPGSLLQIDGVEIGRSPIRKKLRLEYGKHRYEVTKVGHHPASDSFQLMRGESPLLRVSLIPRVYQPRDEPIECDDGDGCKAKTENGWLWLSGVSGGIGLVSEIVALSLYGRYDGGERTDNRRIGYAYYALHGVAALAAVMSLTGLIVHLETKDNDDNNKTTATSWFISPIVAPRPGGVTFGVTIVPQ
jgi:tetratricopeptide (TPR) repeat protein